MKKNVMRRLIKLAAGLAALVSFPAVAQVAVADWVLAKWNGEPYYYPATVISIKDASAVIRFDDGAQDTQPLAALKPYDWKAGSKLECQRTDDSWHAAAITAIDADGVTLDIVSDDGKAERTMTKRCRSL